MNLQTVRQTGPLEVAVVALLHAAALVMLATTRIEPASLRATAPIFGQIVHAPAAATVALRPAVPPAPVPPLAMRSLTPKPRPAPVVTRQRTAPAPLTTRRSDAALTTAVRAAKPPEKTVTPRRETPPTLPRPAPTPAHVAPALVPSPATTAVDPASHTAAVAVPAAAAAPTTAPEQSTGSAISADDNRAYFSALLQRLNRYKVYPAALRKEKIEGRVLLRFTIDARGTVMASGVQRTSGHSALDDAAARILDRASPLPAIPPSMHRNSLTLSVPIEYSLLTDR